MSEITSVWKIIERLKLFYIPWTIFDSDRTDFGLSTEQLRREGFLLPVKRKSKIVYISHRTAIHNDPTGLGMVVPETFAYLKEKRSILDRQFDGFFIHCFGRCSMDDKFLFEDQEDNLRHFISRCYVMVVNDYDNVVKERFWMMWELIHAVRNRRLVINEEVEPFLRDVGMNPDYNTAWALLLNTTNFSENPEHNKLLESLKESFYHDAMYSLIPVHEILEKTAWDDINTFPLTIDHIDAGRLLMISHRWTDPDHPDKSNEKLKKIQTYLKQDENKGRYDYIFFDFICIDQQKSLTKSLAKVDELYARSHCLCLCDGDYFQRSWCLFEMSVNKFNCNSLTLIPEVSNNSVLDWLNQSRLVQQMGYVHALDARPFEIDMGSPQRSVALHLPEDQLHLKASLRSLFIQSNITNQGDRRVLLNLLDVLIRPPVLKY